MLQNDSDMFRSCVYLIDSKLMYFILLLLCKICCHILALRDCEIHGFILYLSRRALLVLMVNQDCQEAKESR